MALSNISKYKFLTPEDLIHSYDALYKRDIILTDLLGKSFDL